MDELILSYSNFINTASGGNEMLASVITLSLITTFLYLSRGIPKLLLTLFTKHAITSFTINNSTWDSRNAISRMQVWLREFLTTSGSRSLSFNEQEHRSFKEHKFTGIGYGIHWFFYNKRFFWVEKRMLESSGSENQKEEYIFKTFGRSHEPFNKLVENFAKEPKQEGLHIWTPDKSDWERKCVIPNRSIDSVALSEEKRLEIFDNINNFKNNKEWFRKASLPYKLSYILYGKPGSGKTSLIKTIASEFGMNLCILNLQYVSDSNLPDLIASMPDNSILAIEDFDSSSAVKDRGIKSSNRIGDVESEVELLDLTSNSSFSMLSLSGLLNALDGLIPVENAIIFLTTNKLEEVDPALYRKGRIDYLMEMNELEGKDVLAFCERMFSNHDFKDYTFTSTMGCNLNEALLYCRGDVDKFVESLKSNGVIK